MSAFENYTDFMEQEKKRSRFNFIRGAILAYVGVNACGNSLPNHKERMFNYLKDTCGVSDVTYEEIESIIFDMVLASGPYYG